MKFKDIDLSDEEALQDFLLDIDCLNELQPWTGHFNLFDVLKISKAEIRHSNMLGWLLNPNENHGIGDAFLKAVVQEMVVKDTDGRYDVFQTLLLDFYSFRIKTNFLLRLKTKLGLMSIAISLIGIEQYWKQIIPNIGRCLYFLPQTVMTPAMWKIGMFSVMLLLQISLVERRTNWNCSRI